MLFEQQQINNYLKQAKLLQRHQVTQHGDWIHAGIARGSPDMEGTGYKRRKQMKFWHALMRWRISKNMSLIFAYGPKQDSTV